jgi:hypothetical protein
LPELLKRRVPVAETAASQEAAVFIGLKSIRIMTGEMQRRQGADSDCNNGAAEAGVTGEIVSGGCGVFPPPGESRFL